MKQVLCVLLLGLLAGCATSTIESRRAEKSAAYAALPADQKAMVDQGQIQVGMSQDAVYIAWGQPAQTLTAQNEQGTLMTWLYHGSVMEETRYWSYREVSRGGRLFLERYLDHDYNPRDYVRAEIVFKEGRVKEWRTLPQPLTRSGRY
ncbi:MAG: hypothetical protein AB1705_17465 [Verrucomicrobiota bacterium]